jgi:hypothetical protein
MPRRCAPTHSCLCRRCRRRHRVRQRHPADRHNRFSGAVPTEQPAQSYVVHPAHADPRDGCGTRSGPDHRLAAPGSAMVSGSRSRGPGGGCGWSGAISPSRTWASPVAPAKVPAVRRRSGDWLTASMSSCTTALGQLRPNLRRPASRQRGRHAAAIAPSHDHPPECLPPGVQHLHLRLEHRIHRSSLFRCGGHVFAVTLTPTTRPSMQS